MDRVFERTMLYDFYGELLNEHKKSIYEDALLNDLSLSEIAEEHEISRQAVHEIIKKCNSQLEEYENKLHLIAKFENAKKKIQQINQLMIDYRVQGDCGCLDQIEKISKEIIDEF